MTTQKRETVSMGVIDFLSADGDVAEAERVQRSEQQERIHPQHEQHAHPIVQVCIWGYTVPLLRFQFMAIQFS